MDSSDRPEARESHTQEDFQRWKERMKAGSGQAADDKRDAPPEDTRAEEKVTEVKRADGEMFSRLDSTFQVDAGMDSFFGLWSERKPVQEAQPEVRPSENVVVPDQPSSTSRPTKSSRFAGIFNVQSDGRVTESAQPESAARPASTDADQEGFQRILQMLGGNKSRNATPHTEPPVQSRPAPPPQDNSQPEFSHRQAHTMPPAREPPVHQDYSPYTENVAHEHSPSLENLAQKASKEGAAHNRDAEFLLRLMQQSRISQPAPNPHPPHLPSHAAPSMPEMHPRPQGMPKIPGYADQMITNPYRPESNDPREQLRRRTTAGGGYFDELGYHGPPAASMTPNNLPGMRPQPPVQPPMNLQRPPGLEQVVSPGWPNQQPPQAASNHPMAPPPGLSNPHNRNMNPNFPSGPPMPLSTGMPLPNDRQPQFQRGVASAGPTGFGPPPGIMPPPGYMNMNVPPPPVFPPMPQGPEGMIGMPHGAQNQYGSPQPVPHHQSRHLLDMFAHPGAGPNDGGMGGRNGMGMMGPGGYR
jgi:hypothetical protein